MSTNLAWKNLTRDKPRFAISVGAVAFAVLLILIVAGIYSGISQQATEYIRTVGADVWVVESDSSGDFFHGVSTIPADVAPSLVSVEGVTGVSPLIARPVVFDRDGRDVDLFLLGVSESGPGSPASVTDGVRTPGRGEIVIDRVFAQNEDVRIGDSLVIRDTEFRVVGIARGGNAIVTQFAWINLADAEQLIVEPGLVNYFLLSTSTVAEAPAVVDRIRAEIPSVKALTAEAFADNNTADLREGFLPIVWVLVIIAFFIGTAIIGLTIYTATIEKQREYGVLKAIGLSNRRLLSVIIQQSLAAGAIGFVVGVGLTAVVRILFEWLLPSFVTTLRPVDVAFVAVAALFMSLLASLVPARPLVRLDPASVFRT